MTYSITYSSLTGNTKLLAETVRDTLEGREILYFGEVDNKAREADVILVGFWTDKGICDLKNQEFLKSIHGKKIFIFGSCGFGLSEEYYKSIIENTLDLISSDNEILGSFICLGRMQNKVRERYEAMLSIEGAAERANMLIENFDIALSHPDEEDLKRLKKSVLEALE